MRRRIVQMAWGLFALSLVAGWHDTARGEDPALVNEKKMQATGSWSWESALTGNSTLLWDLRRSWESSSWADPTAAFQADAAS